MDLKFIKKVIGVALLGAAAMTSTNAMAAQANVQIDVDLPTVLVMYHYDTITLDITQAAMADYLVGGTATTCGTGYCDEQTGSTVTISSLSGSNTILQPVGDPGPLATTVDFTMQDVVGVRAIGCTAPYTATYVDGGSTAGVTLDASLSVDGIDGLPCSFAMQTGDLSFEIDFDALPAATSTASAIFDVTITGV